MILLWIINHVHLVFKCKWLFNKSYGVIGKMAFSSIKSLFTFLKNILPFSNEESRICRQLCFSLVAYLIHIFWMNLEKLAIFEEYTWSFQILSFPPFCSTVFSAVEWTSNRNKLIFVVHYVQSPAVSLVFCT